MSPQTAAQRRPAGLGPRRISTELRYRGLPSSQDLPFPLILQRRAPHVLRRHVLSGIVRVSTLLVADLAVMAAIRTVFRGIAVLGWFGPTVALAARFSVPRGYFPFFQLAVAVTIGLALFGNYRSGDHRHDGRSLMLGSGFGVGLTVWVRLWSDFNIARFSGAMVLILALGLSLCVSRHLIEVLVRHVRARRGPKLRVVVVGAYDDVARTLADRAIADGEFEVAGFVDTSDRRHPDALGGLEELVHVLDEHRADIVLLAGSFGERRWSYLMHVADAAGCQVLTHPGPLMLEGFSPKLIVRRGTPFVEITRPTRRAHHLLVKRVLDLAASAVALALLTPVLAAIALAVRLTSAGPIFFRQTRVGQGGKYFTIYKFRSMVVDAEARLEKLKASSVYGDGRLFKMERDPRITPIGSFLRRTSLDELPQLWNVLRGDMSLVGPRPPIPSEVVLYDDHHYTRFDVKPGITGPWQVAGRNAIRDFDRVVELETAYIRYWSFWKDLEILWRTVPVVLRMEGAY